MIIGTNSQVSDKLSIPPSLDQAVSCICRIQCAVESVSLGLIPPQIPVYALFFEHFGCSSGVRLTRLGDGGGAEWYQVSTCIHLVSLNRLELLSHILSFVRLYSSIIPDCTTPFFLPFAMAMLAIKTTPTGNESPDYSNTRSGRLGQT